MTRSVFLKSTFVALALLIHRASAGDLPSSGICGHGCDLASCPENSLVGLRSAIDKGVKMVEFDVQRCKTGELVCLHDGDLSWKTTVTGMVRQASFEYIRSAKLKHERYVNEQVPTLDEMLDALPRSGVLANVHCYGDLFVARDAALKIKKKGLLQQAVVASDLPSIANARAVVPEIKACNMTRPAPAHPEWTIEQHRKYLKSTIENKCQFLQIRWRWPKELSDEAHAAGVKVNYCPVLCDGSDPEQLESILATGVDFVFCEKLDPVLRKWCQLRENPVPAGGVAVWTADSMRRVSVLSYPSLIGIDVPASINLSMVRNERESAQVLLTCGAKKSLSSVSVELSQLTNSHGKVMAGNWKWERLGYVPRLKSANRHPYGIDAIENWMPDPLLPAARFSVRPGLTQGVWLTFYTATEAQAGVYTGNVRISEDNRDLAVIPVRIEVSPTMLPKTFSTHNSFTFYDTYLRRLYPDKFNQMRRAGWDLMLDHRLSPDNIYREELAPIGELLYARSRGMNLFNVLSIPYDTPVDHSGKLKFKTPLEAYKWHYPAFLAEVKPYVEQLRLHGLDKLAYFYGFDEKEKEFYPALDFCWRSLQRDFPGIPFMSTSRAYQDISAGVADLPSEARSGDWFCPELCLWDDKLTRLLRSQGRKVWWYVCCGPHHPYANFAALEAPPVDARVLGWMTRHFDVDGFLFWAVNYWGRPGHAPMPDSDTFLDWDSSIDSNSNGDGVLVYPGRDTLYPSVRLANVRDGVEDGELLKMLAAKDAAKAKVASGRLIRKTTDFSRDPALIRSARDDVMRALAPPVKNPGRNGKHFPSAAGVSLRERKIDVKAGDRWQIDWSWREICVPPTALLRPRITAYDKSGKAVFSANVGQIQQRTFKPEDLSVQCWRVYVNVEKNALEVNGKKENYAEAIDTVTLPAGTTGVVLKLVREGDVAEVKDVVINAERLQGLRPRQFAGFPEMSESSSEILTDRELDLVLSHRPLLKPKLVRSGDRTDLAVNGKRVVPRIFKTAAFNVPNRLPSVTALSRKGFNIVTVGLSLTPSADPSREATSGIWRADGTIDTQKVRMEIRRTLKRAPDAMLMLVFIIQPPPGWAEANPSEILRSYDRKFAFVRGVYRVTDYRTSLDYDWRKDELPAVSHASEKYAEDVARVLEKIFSDLETWPEGKAVIGTYLNGGTDTQWLDAFDTDLAGRPAADYSDVCARRFARWQRERKYTELEIPAPERFWDEKRAHYAEHAQTTMGSWRRFYAQASAQLRLTMAKAVKKGSKGRVLVGSYSPNGGLAGYPLIAQTCTEKLMSSPDWDFFAVVPDYVREHPDPVLSAVFDGSLVGNSKLFVSELDLRSHDVGNWGSWGSSFWREHHTDETFRRKTLTFVANAVTHGGGYHAYDMDGGMYATPAAQETWRIANRIAAHAHGEEPAGTRIALLSGERYWDNHSLASQRIVPYQLREFPRDALSRTGAAWNSYLVDDLLKNPAADLPPVVLVADATTMSREDVATLRKRYGCDGRVIIWCYRLGLFASDGEAIEQEMGLKLAPEGLASVGFADGNNADLLMRNVSGSLIALWPVWGLDHPRLTYADPDKGWLPLANFHGTNLPALSVRRHPDFTEIYSSRPGGVTPALLRNCLRAAGHRPLMEGNDISGYGSGIFYFVAQSSGERCFRLPEGKVPHKKLYGPDYRSLGDGRYSLTVRRGDIFILSTR